MSPRRKALITLLKLTDVAVVIAALVGPSPSRWDEPASIPDSASSRCGSRSRTCCSSASTSSLGISRFVFAVSTIRIACRRPRASSKISPPPSRIATAPLVPMSLPFGFEYVTPHFLVLFPDPGVRGIWASSAVLLRAVARKVRSLGRNLRDVIIVGDGGPALEAAPRGSLNATGSGTASSRSSTSGARRRPLHVNGNGYANGTTESDPLFRARDPPRVAARSTKCSSGSRSTGPSR